jgi:hypothetical protein
MTPKRRFLVWADKVVLVMALFIACGAFLCWVLGIIGLEGLPHPRFDSAMIDWTVTAELMLVPPLWLALRLLDFGAKALGRWMRSNLGRVGTGGLRLSS